ncbi:class I SAM-dependent methyltransferase [Dictyobacter kobayashii]|uniref:Methyltransferase n=1 Tax=Dictyobacter kobayashii TaxID=2014872 RepID=A0A402AL31_9CHLR|nr:class I SAM-dependent methyltransferase [Dictyobacter kobayashii]GCE19918.1 methyltransferase [Dictyobacter kobayashii]
MGEKADQALFDSLTAEYNRPFHGWDFSYLSGRMISIKTTPTWDYTNAVIGAMNQAHTMLDMHTGGGEVLAQLLSLRPVPEVYATELYAPNVIAARQRLTPLAVTVYTARDECLPFPDNTLDLVINRHGSYNPAEVLRVLKPEQVFITQQVGDQTNRTLHELLGREKLLEHAWNMDYAAQEMEDAGWHIIERKEEFFTTRFHDVGAIVYYLKAVPWEVPDFSVERYWHQLVEIHHLLQKEGQVDIPFHSFFLIARKP